MAAIALASALALTTSLVRLGDVPPGFRTGDIAAMQLFRAPGEVPQFTERALEELAAIPGVRDVAAVSSPPLAVVARVRIEDIAVEGRASAEPISSAALHASAGYHGFLGIPLLRGRDITERDVAGAPSVVVVNEAFARRAFGTLDVVGRTLRLPQPFGVPGLVPFEIVGVAADTRNAGLRAPTEPELVFSVQQVRWNGGITLMAESDVAPPSWMRTLEQAVWRVDADQTVFRSFMLADDLAAQMQDARFFAAATGWFAVLALLLAAGGINALVAAIERRRTREIGLRLALGAAPRQAAALVLGNAARILGLGLVAGALLAVPALGWLRGELFNVSGGALWGLYGLTALVVAAIGLAAVGWPAWRASRVAPMEALRHE